MGICCGISTKWLLIHCFQIELELRSAQMQMQTFVEGGKPVNLEKCKHSEQGQELTTNSTHIKTSGPGIKPEPHWWEASALTQFKTRLLPELQRVLSC